jgi:hypothetical protein
VIMQPIALRRSMSPNIYGWSANSTGGIRSIVRWLRFLGARKAGASSESTGGRRVRRDAWQVLSRHLPIWYTSGCFVSSMSARWFQPRDRSGNKGDDSLARSRSGQREKRFSSQRQVVHQNSAARRLSSDGFLPIVALPKTRGKNGPTLTPNIAAKVPFCW